MTSFITWLVSLDWETQKTPVAAGEGRTHHAHILQLTGEAVKASVGGPLTQSIATVIMETLVLLVRFEWPIITIPL